MEKQICCIKACENEAQAHSICNTHWRRIVAFGDPFRTKQVQFHGLSPADRFWKWVNKTEKCWLWTGRTNKTKPGTGAGQFRIVGRKNPILAHRFSWELVNGPVPDGMCVCHKCDVPYCVRPDHLFLGTQSDNSKDMWSKGRANPDGRNSRIT